MKCISGIEIMFSNTVLVCVGRRKYWRACVISGSDNLRWVGGGMSAEIIPLISCSGVLEAGGPTGRSAPSTPGDQDLSIVHRPAKVHRSQEIERTQSKQREGLPDGKQLELQTPSPTFIWPLTLIIICGCVCVGSNWSQSNNNRSTGLVSVHCAAAQCAVGDPIEKCPLSPNMIQILLLELESEIAYSCWVQFCAPVHLVEIKSVHCTNSNTMQ